MIIDCHGHYTTAPKALEEYRGRQIAGFNKDTASVLSAARPDITDDQIRESLENAQLKMQRERGTDLTIFSPRAGGMGHHIGDAATSRHWSETCNELIHRVCNLYPDDILFASEMVGAVRGVDPETGHHYDDTRRYIDAVEWLGAEDKQKNFQGNARRIYSRLGEPRAAATTGAKT